MIKTDREVGLREESEQIGKIVDYVAEVLFNQSHEPSDLEENERMKITPKTLNVLSMWMYFYDTFYPSLSKTGLSFTDAICATRNSKIFRAREELRSHYALVNGGCVNDQERSDMLRTNEIAWATRWASRTPASNYEELVKMLTELPYNVLMRKGKEEKAELTEATTLYFDSQGEVNFFQSQKLFSNIWEEFCDYFLVWNAALMSKENIGKN